MNQLKKLALTASAYLLPAVVFAQVGGEVGNLTDLFVTVNGIINTIVPFIVGIAVFIIIWGVFTYIAGAGDEEKRAQAKSFIIWGVVGVFIMLSIWGLVNILVNSINLRKTPVDEANLPTFDFDFPAPAASIIPPIIPIPIIPILVEVTHPFRSVFREDF